MSKRSKQVIGHILIVIFALYYANICFFYHSHIINGVTIVHSHFYSKDHVQAGSHSASELTLISTLSDFQSPQAVLGFIDLGIVFFLLTIIRLISKERLYSNSVTCVSLRAPPSFIV